MNLSQGVCYGAGINFLIEFDDEIEQYSFLKSGSETFTFTAEGGQSNLLITNTGESRLEVDVDVDRKLMLDWMAFPLGIILLSWAIWRKSLDAKEQ